LVRLADRVEYLESELERERTERAELEEKVKELEKKLRTREGVAVTPEHGVTNKFYEVVYPPLSFRCVLTVPAIPGILDYIEDAVKAVFMGVVGIGGLRSSGFGRLKQISLKRETVNMDVQAE